MYALTSWHYQCQACVQFAFDGLRHLSSRTLSRVEGSVFRLENRTRLRTADTTTHPSSAWGPLARPVFRALWLAALASNIGSLMQGVAAAWLMTSLTSSPVPVALLTTMSNLPLFLIGLPAGAIADMVDRRWL